MLRIPGPLAASLSPVHPLKSQVADSAVCVVGVIWASRMQLVPRTKNQTGGGLALYRVTAPLVCFHVNFDSTLLSKHIPQPVIQFHLHHRWDVASLSCFLARMHLHLELRLHFPRRTLHRQPTKEQILSAPLSESCHPWTIIGCSYCLDRLTLSPKRLKWLNG